MKKQDFIGELISYGTGFALSFLVLAGMAVVFAVFLCVIAVVGFLNRLLH